MALTAKKIFLDFNVNNIVTINAKQLDTRSRYVNVTCTDHGAKVALNSNRESAFVRCTKSDGNPVFNDAFIDDNDGTVNIELTQQMLAVTGRQKVDLLIVAKSGLSVNDIAEANGFYKLESCIISTMTFYISVNPTAADHSPISSSYEFNSLLKGIDRLVKLETTVQQEEEKRVEAETDRDTAEKERVSAENSRVDAEKARVNAENLRVQAENSRVQAENSRVSNETTRNTNEESRTSRFNTAIANAQNATNAANNAATNANNAAQDCRDALQTGVIYQSEKGAANGVATLDENAKVSVDQLYTVQTYNDIHNKTGLVYSTAIVELEEKEINPLYDAVAGLSRQIENLPHIYSGTDVPDNSIGKDGDIYLKIIG